MSSSLSDSRDFPAAVGSVLIVLSIASLLFSNVDHGFLAYPRAASASSYSVHTRLKILYSYDSSRGYCLEYVWTIRPCLARSPSPFPSLIRVPLILVFPSQLCPTRKHMNKKEEEGNGTWTWTWTWTIWTWVIPVNIGCFPLN
jgi:hypothetical protein